MQELLDALAEGLVGVRVVEGIGGVRVGGEGGHLFCVLVGWLVAVWVFVVWVFGCCVGVECKANEGNKLDAETRRNISSRVN